MSINQLKSNQCQNTLITHAHASNQLKPVQDNSTRLHSNNENQITSNCKERHAQAETQSTSPGNVQLQLGRVYRRSRASRCSIRTCTAQFPTCAPHLLAFTGRCLSPPKLVGFHIQGVPQNWWAPIALTDLANWLAPPCPSFCGLRSRLIVHVCIHALSKEPFVEILSVKTGDLPHPKKSSSKGAECVPSDRFTPLLGGFLAVANTRGEANRNRF